MESTFSGWVARAERDKVVMAVETLTAQSLPPGDVTIRVERSSVNYKDALAVTARGGVVRTYPIVPGIDLVGEVVSSDSAEFGVGDRVLAHGSDIGTARDGGYTEYTRLPAEWVVPLPEGLSADDAATIGTAGFTAAMSVDALVSRGLRPSDGPVLVTGASGGVGSVSVDLLAAAGFEVVASSGKEGARELLTTLGASDVIGRLPEDPEAKPKPLGKARWAAAIDCVGGATLAHVLSTVKYGGAVAASGLTGGSSLPTTVLPFILRGVSLIGIDSVQLPIGPRRELWARIGGELKPAHLSSVTYDVAARDVVGVLDTVREGRSTGRALVRVADGF